MKEGVTGEPSLLRFGNGFHGLGFRVLGILMFLFSGSG